MNNLSFKLKVEKLSKSFFDAGTELEIIKNLTFDFSGLDSIAILGRSGIGKSTLLHLLGGLESPTSGSIVLNNERIDTFTTNQLAVYRQKNISFVFQFHHLLAEFSALENVAMPLLVAKLNENEASERALQYLNKLGLKNRVNHRPTQLSGGEQARVALARALVTKPNLLLADEPTGNLDDANTKEVIAILKELAENQGCKVIVVTHNEDLASAMNKTLIMQAGGALYEHK